MKKITRYFFEGLIFVAPIAITVYVLYSIFIGIDRMIPVSIPGLGFLATVALITLIGFLASNFLTRGALSLIEKIFGRLPLIRLLHSSLKDVMTAFVGDKKKFDKPVVVELFAGADVKALGFVTREALEQFALADQVAVYFPQSFNFAGNLLIYPRNQVKPLDAESSKVMAFIVSGGIA